METRVVDAFEQPWKTSDYATRLMCKLLKATTTAAAGYAWSWHRFGNLSQQGSQKVHYRIGTH